MSAETRWRNMIWSKKLTHRPGEFQWKLGPPRRHLVGVGAVFLLHDFAGHVHGAAVHETNAYEVLGRRFVAEEGLLLLLLLLLLLHGPIDGG